MDNIARDAKIASYYVFFGLIVSNILKLASNLVLTRLLMPEAYAMMATILLVNVFFELMSDVGIRQSIVIEPNPNSRSFLNTIWTTKCIRGLLLSTLTLVVSLFLHFADFDGDSVWSNDELPGLLMINAFYPALMGLVSPSLILAERNLLLKKKIFIDIISQFSGITCGVLYAVFLSATVHALMVSLFISIILKVVLSHSLFVQRMGFGFDKEIFLKIFHFGKHIALSTSVGFLQTRGSKIIFSVILNEQRLGIFVIALFLFEALRDVFVKIIGTVFFPMISIIKRRSLKEAKDLYYRYRLRLDCILFFLSGVLYATAQDIVGILYDSRYASAGEILGVLSLVIPSIGTGLVFQLLMSSGKSKSIAVMTIINTVLFYILVCSGYLLYGEYGALWCIVAVSYLRLFVSAWYESKIYGRLPLHRLFPVVLLPIGIGFGSIISYLSGFVI